VKQTLNSCNSPSRAQLSRARSTTRSMAVIEELDAGSEGAMDLAEGSEEEQTTHDIEEDPTRMPPPGGKYRLNPSSFSSFQ
jgi:hypothetical protein